MLPTDPTLRKETPIARGVLDYFPDAIAAVAHVSFVGNRQHNPGEEMHWARAKSSDHADCIARHLIERGTIDNDNIRHSAKVAWRALAMLQLELESDAVPTEQPTIEAPITRKGGSKIYIAGPMRGYPELNFPAFDTARDAFTQAGWIVTSPACLSRASGNTMDRGYLDHEYNRACAETDTNALLGFRAENGDAIAMLPGWETSTGAVAELSLARWLGLRIYDAGGSLLRSARLDSLGRSIANFLNDQ